jgi:hypothetical protein
MSNEERGNELNDSNGSVLELKEEYEDAMCRWQSTNSTLNHLEMLRAYRKYITADTLQNRRKT